jgi:LmbE family N-acetylglucosaminyl deacetylase
MKGTLESHMEACDRLHALFGSGARRSIREMTWPRDLRLMELAPHPDDFDAIGVTFRFLALNGNHIEVGVVRTGSGVDDSYRPGATILEKAAIREQEQRNSMRFFGLPERCLTFLPLSNDDDDQPVDSPANCELLAEFVAKKAPDVVLLPHGNDTNSGHRAMHSLVAQLGRRSDHAFVALLSRDPKTIAMRTDLYMPFCGSEATWKAKLLRFHDSQHKRNLATRGHGFDNRILDMNARIADELSLRAPYAEAFEVEFHGQVGK